MAKQFENPKETELEDKTTTNATPQKKIEDVADKAAEKAGKTERKFDEAHTIFSN